ncbi:MAG: hypothetical protein QOC99_2651 [Acidobacteriota bacterium]|nr:hypothetical protein [Acidobacteriota bacterium]MDT7780139.1 hypothetical protein [Acidobacteriota bacterium]
MPPGRSKALKVSAILIITVFLIFVASFAILRTKRTPSKEDTEHLPPGVSARGLFDVVTSGSLVEGDREAFDDGQEAPEKLEESLRERAARGDLEALRDARATGDMALYRSVLDGLVGRSAESPADLHALAAYIAQSDDLRSTPALAEMLLEGWRQNPERAPTVELLRVSALSDDAGTFGRAVSEVLQIWEDGRLGGVSAGELRSLFESEYWLLSSEAKRSGEGFVLKQKLADARRRLAANDTSVENPHTDAGFPREVPAEKERQ